MVVAKQMQDAVDKQVDHFTLKRMSELFSLFSGAVHADHYVAQLRDSSLLLHVDHVVYVIELRERKHIRYAIYIPVVPVQCLYLIRRYERHAYLSPLRIDPLFSEDHRKRLLHRLPVDLLLVFTFTALREIDLHYLLPFFSYMSYALMMRLTISLRTTSTSLR